MTGRFAVGVGTFTGDDRVAACPVKVRFECVSPRPGRPRWSRAFGTDDARWRSLSAAHSRTGLGVFWW
jgi:hypothetical protein